MDSALLLRTKFDRGDSLSDAEIQTLLTESKLVEKLTKDYQEDRFFCLFRLMALSEIPYAQRLPYTQKVLAFVSDHLALQEGFFLYG